MFGDPSSAIDCACALLLAGIAAGGCGGGEDEEPVGVLAQIADGRWTGQLLPPINTGCGTKQPGYDPGDPEGTPPIPPSKNGSPYVKETDPFCTAAWTRRWYTDEAGAHVAESLYVAEMGEPDPGAELERWQHPGGYRCTLTWGAVAEPVGSYPVSDLQHVTITLEDVTPDCAAAFELDPPAQEVFYLFRMTDPRLVVAVFDDRLLQQGDSFLFQGFIGLEDTGGVMTLDSNGGFAQYDLPCSPVTVPGEDGPGICTQPDGTRMCRQFSASAEYEGDFPGGRPACTWDDVHALPANKELVHPDWCAQHQSLCHEFYGRE